MLNALLAIIPITILFFWFQSMGKKEKNKVQEFDCTEDFYNN